MGASTTVSSAPASSMFYESPSFLHTTYAFALHLLFYFKNLIVLTVEKQFYYRVQLKKHDMFILNFRRPSTGNRIGHVPTKNWLLI
jgi:hypothetical protein